MTRETRWACLPLQTMNGEYPRSYLRRKSHKAGSPWLDDQSETYLKAQLRAFASGQRTNDISQQMRNIARAMTPREIDDAAAYCASQPPEVFRATD